MADQGCVPGETQYRDVSGGKMVTVEYCLTRGDSIGLALTAESGLLSLGAIVVLFLLIIRNVWRERRQPADQRRKLLQEPADVLMLSLFAADLIQALGAVMDIRWANKGFVEVGAFCTAQGALQQLGETTVALSTLIIALQTFIAIWFRRFVHNMRAAYACVLTVWLFVVLYVAIGSGLNQKASLYYDPTPYWCWIGQGYLAERITGEYVWMWLALFVSVFVYVPLFLWGRGYLAVDRAHWWRIALRTRPLPRGAEQGQGARDRPPRLSLAILGYPAIYSIIILPLSIVRWITFARGDAAVPSAGTFAVIFLFGLSGAANVLLLLTTRPNLLLFDSHYYDEDSDDELITADNLPGVLRRRSSAEAGAAGGAGAGGMVHTDRLGVSTGATGVVALGGSGSGGARGRQNARWRLHEQGRIATPSRSSSRVPSIRSIDGADAYTYGFGPSYAGGTPGLADYNSHFSRSAPSDSGAPVMALDEDSRHSSRPHRVSDGTTVTASSQLEPEGEYDLGSGTVQIRLGRLERDEQLRDDLT